MPNNNKFEDLTANQILDRIKIGSRDLNINPAHLAQISQICFDSRVTCIEFPNIVYQNNIQKNSIHYIQKSNIVHTQI